MKITENTNSTKTKNRLATKWLFTKNRSCSCTMPGVWRAVSFCEGCAVIFHSPLGCAHVATLMDLGAQYRIIGDHQNENLDAVPLISSNLQEKESIFGGVEKLKGCIAYVMKTWQPRCLVIATSCVAGVIGDDVEQAAVDAEADYNVPVLCVPYGGFLGGEYADGYFQTVRFIMERFIRPQPKVPGRVLLFGDQMGPCGQYAREVRRLLARFGLEVKWQFPGYVPFREWPELSSASLLIPLSYAGQTRGGLEKTAAEWAERFQIPSISDVYPVGWQNTCSWLRKIAAFTGDGAKGEEVIRQEEKRLGDFVKSVLNVTKNKNSRASASMLNGIEVDYYGSPTPVNQIASITSPEPRQLLIKPYDRNDVKNIITAINVSNLGINPINEGTAIRLIIPVLTEERRKEIVKQARKYCEEAKVAVRNIRRDYMDILKIDDSYSEDLQRRAQDDIQKVTDEAIKKIDVILQEKEKEIMAI